MLRKRRYMMIAAALLLMALLGMFLYDTFTGVRTSPGANGVYFVMEGTETHGKRAIQ